MVLMPPPSLFCWSGHLAKAATAQEVPIQGKVCRENPGFSKPALAPIRLLKSGYGVLMHKKGKNRVTKL